MSKAAEFWKSHIEALQREAVSVEAYAQTHGLKPSTLRWWRSKLRGEARVAQSAPPSRFVALRVSDPQPNASGTVTVSLGSELRVQLPGLPAPQWLAALAQAMHEVR